MSKTYYSLGAGRHIDTVMEDVDTMEELINKISLESGPGSDDAVDAGFDPDKPDEINSWALECQAMAARLDDYDKRINAKLQALKDYEDTIPGTRDGAREDEGQALHKASVQVLRLLLRTPTKFQTFLQGLGIPMTEEVKEALQRASTSVTDSQATELLQGGTWSVKVLDLEIQLSAKEMIIKDISGQVEIQKQLVKWARGEKDKLQRDLNEKCKALDDLDKQATLARRETRKYSSKVLALQKELDEANGRISRLEGEVNELKETEIADKEEHAGQTRLLQAQAIQLGQEKAEMAIERNDLKAELERARKDAASRLKKSDNATREALQNVSEIKGSLSASRRELGEVREENRSLKQQLSRLEGIENHANDLNGQLVAQRRTTSERDATIEKQVNDVALLLRNISFETESSFWRTIAENALSGSDSACVTHWKPWRISSSWSPDEALSVYDDDRLLEAVTLDAVAILCAEGDVTQLLTMLQGFQDGIIGQPTLSPIAQLLLRSFPDAVADERLHLIHRISMYQVATLLAPSAEDILPLSQAMDAVDRRVGRLVRGLKARDIDEYNSPPLLDSISYGDATLVGFSGEPAGVLYLKDHEMRWVDRSRIQSNVGEIAILTGDETLLFPADNAETARWSLMHL
ncbi:uncharacterized protein FFE2_08581 [Fusarium fujikuroi]|uniref:Uncharacterized protein n=1 Tax=Fusarium fujikuroi TaxID=5127 RepID=A0A9Q9UD09_FUSFU|nr:uncharacterized protein FFE2_08581 [Fusarium fujikuroi]VTT74592.1 unnamed protein product [Fusarium fujikuroi]